MLNLLTTWDRSVTAIQNKMLVLVGNGLIYQIGKAQKTTNKKTQRTYQRELTITKI